MSCSHNVLTDQMPTLCITVLLPDATWRQIKIHGSQFPVNTGAEIKFTLATLHFAFHRSYNLMMKIVQIIQLSNLAQKIQIHGIKCKQIFIIKSHIHMLSSQAPRSDCPKSSINLT